MYAVVSSGGKQYRVEAGSELIVERLTGDTGSTITFDRVLLVGDGEAVTIGTPTVAGATVSGTVLGEVLGPKLIIFKFKQKATYRRKNGHRQHLTRVRIDEISGAGKSGKAAKAAKADADEAGAEADAAPKAPKAPKASKAESATTSEASDPKPAARKRTAKAAAGDEKPKAARARTTKAKADKADKADKAEE